MAAGLPGVLVRTGKYRRDALPAVQVTPTAVVDSIKDFPPLFQHDVQRSLPLELRRGTPP